MDTIIHIDDNQSTNIKDDMDIDIENNLLIQKPTLRTRFVRIALFLLTKKALRMRGGFNE